MLPAFIESLIRRWSPNQSPPKANGVVTPALDAPDPAVIQRVTTFWYDAIRFVGLDDLIREHNSAPEITFEEAMNGHVNRSAPSEAQRSSSETGQAATEIVVAIGLAPQEWFRLRGKSARARYLLAIPARQDGNGYLFPASSGDAPFFNPSRIQSNDQRNDVFITTHDTVSAWMEAHPLPNAQEWPPLWNYAVSMLTGALSEPVTDVETARETLSRSLGLTTPQDWIIKIVPAAATNDAASEIARLYGSMLEPDERVGSDLRTYERLMWGCDGNAVASGEVRARADAEVLGHIDAFNASPRDSRNPRPTRDIYPLDPSQRQAVRHACRLHEGEILAINGPPGTGKTATLRAVIASYWVRAALTQERPPIIVGCGATNQAVTNITEAFVEAAHGQDDYVLAQRWNPFVSSYGMFFASDTFAKENADKIRKYQGFQKSVNIKERCLFSLREARNPFSPNELSELKAHYLGKATEAFKLRGIELDQIVTELRALLRKCAIDIPAHIRGLMAYAISGSRRDVSSDRQISSWVMPLISRQNDFSRTKVFNRFVEYIRDPSPRHVQDIMNDAECDESEAARLLAEMLIDCSLRPHAFHIAAWYWEGRFLQTAAVRLHARSEENLKDALQRVCMLAPCIVSTVNSLPKLFAIEHKNPDRPRNFAYGAADLMIMDESGQALPESGAGCFALAKRAVVVGDLKQLEPVANIQPQNEIALLGRRNAVKDYDYLVDTFKAPSSGSILAMAQRASSYHDRFGNGVSLLFHYRCVRPIIGFCNRLCYGGMLKAKTAEGSGQWPPPLAWVEISRPASKREGSWVNDSEANEIAGWLRSAWPRISAQQDGAPTIDRVVAVLSPFRPQINALRKAIAKAFESRPEDIPAETVWPSSSDIEAMTIGTVHSLQGAERPIVVFSGTVSTENTAVAFFDSSSSILNVAVSRAKKSFIYFGDPAYLFRYDRDGRLTSGKPSAILGDHMRAHPLARRLYPLYLVIVEAPGKREVIAEILGKDYHVVATGGAIRKIGSGDLGLGFDRGLRPRWAWRERTDKPLVQTFSDLAKTIDTYEKAYVATDADMEGEAIAWHVTEALAEFGGPSVRQKIHRVRLGDITRPALLEAFQAPGSIDVNIASAAIARAIADRLIADRLHDALNRPGTPTETQKETKICRTILRGSGKPHRRPSSMPVHLGRVQTGIIRILYNEAREKAEELAELGRFRIAAKIGNACGYVVLPERGGREYRINAPDLELARKRLDAIVQDKLPGMIADYEHDGIEHKEHNIGPPRFLSTIEIMRRAVRYGLMPWETMQALQNLYLGKIVKDDDFGGSEL